MPTRPDPACLAQRNARRARTPWALLWLLAACHTAVRADPLPAHVPTVQRHSTVALEHFELTDNAFRIRCASAVVISERLLLTAKHYWEDVAVRRPDGTEAARLEITCRALPLPWQPPGAPPTRQAVVTLRRASPADLDPESDWVLLRADAPCWEPYDLATLHAPLLGSEPAVATGTGWLLGFANELVEATELEGTAPTGPFPIRGTITHDADQVVLDDADDRAAPTGASGGGLYVETTNGLELIGVFTTWRGLLFRTTLCGVSLRRIVDQARLAGIDLVAEQQRTRDLLAGEPTLRNEALARVRELQSALAPLEQHDGRHKLLAERLATTTDPMTRQLLHLACAGLWAAAEDEAKTLAELRAAVAVDPQSAFLRTYGAGIRAAIASELRSE